MNTPRLLEKDKNKICMSLEGQSYIKDSNKRSDNLRFWTTCNINTETNECIVKYKVECFEPKNSDYDSITTTNYSEAIDKYNELAVKWDGYRFN